MRSALITLLATFLSLVSLSPVTTHGYTWGFPYDSQKVRGVNLGGWLVLEVSSFLSRIRNTPFVEALLVPLAMDYPFLV